jgi:hypothetical protein
VQRHFENVINGELLNILQLLKTNTIPIAPVHLIPVITQYTPYLRIHVTGARGMEITHTIHIIIIANRMNRCSRMIR